MRKITILTLATAFVLGISFNFASDVLAQRPGRVAVRPQPARVAHPAPDRPAPVKPAPAPAPHHPAPAPHHPAPPPHHYGPNTWGELIGDVIDAAIRESHRP